MIPVPIIGAFIAYVNKKIIHKTIKKAYDKVKKINKKHQSKHEPDKNEET